MPHDDLQRLSLRLGVVGAMTAQAKETAGRLSSGADEYERALLKRTNTLARQIRREGVGKNPKLEQEYCELLMQRRRMLQSYELAKQDAAKSPDVTATKSLRKSLQPVPFEALPTIYLIASSPAARQLAVSLSSSGIEALATSDLESAVATAAILHEVLGVPVAAPQPGFRSWDLGALSGLPDTDTGPFVRRYVEDHADLAPPNGESFNAYHERFMTSLTPMLILVGRGVRRAIGIVTDPWNLLLAQAWLHSGGKLGDLDLRYFVGRVLDPGTVLRMTLTAEGWEGTLFPPMPEHQGEGLFITALPPDMTLMKGRGGKGTQPGQLGFSFDEEAHPRQQAGEHGGKYKGGEFVPKSSAARDWAKGIKLPVTFRDYPEGGARPFGHYAPEEKHIYLNNEFKEHLQKYRRYGVPLGEAVLAHETMHHLWHVAFGNGLNSNPKWRAAIEALEQIPHSGVVDEHPKGNILERAVETLAVDTIDPGRLSEAEREWAESVKEQAYANRHRDTREDPRQEWTKKGTRSQAFKGWFGDWEHNPANASKVVDAAGKPKETYEVEGSKVTDELGQARVVYHGTAQGGWSRFEVNKQNPSSLYGPGFYFTEDEGVAESYQVKDTKYRLERDLTDKDMKAAGRLLNSKMVRSEMMEDIGLRTNWRLAQLSHEEGREEFQDYLTKSDMPTTKKILAHLGITRTQQGNPETFAVYLNIRQPFDMDKPLSREQTEGLRKAMTATGIPSKWLPEYDIGLTGHVAFKLFEESRHDTEQPAGTRARTGEEFASRVIKAAGYDGITHIGGGRMGGGHAHRVWIAFEPEQIKSADNEGTFDPTSPDIRKSVNGGPFVPPDMPRWQQRPDGGEQRFLPLNGVEDRDKLRGMIETMREGKWTWDKPIVNSGDQLLTGSHRYHAAKEAGVAVPLKDFGEVCQEGGIDFEKEWRERAEPYGGWISNVSNVIRLLPEGLAKKYGIELG